MSALVPCPHCSRHVLAHEAACPFCSGSLEGVAPRSVPAEKVLSRAAVVFMGATALAACGKEPAPPPPPAPVDTSKMAAPAYGPPPQDLTPPTPVPNSTLDAGPLDAGKPKK